ncbi:hypothetical protein L202_05909 [Cryptococcus amylolentus CBS 6039]|uniref:Uncharacterized protein n=1 Tax=Cryptococcus amylolentus CBS 6039 TaxID=1295533 RepID=A0A1E3HHW5_9TREE|nr:hypothetical protein L202_05909 [Cryptococcus amylolentus CBS 6039]ODN75924.1 hypothetical protein L202_05909 [Cryptococcus amylolentus CBS 6039]
MSLGKTDVLGLATAEVAEVEVEAERLLGRSWKMCGRVGAETVTDGAILLAGSDVDSDKLLFDNRFFAFNFSNAELSPAKDLEVSSDNPSRLLLLKLNLGRGPGFETERFEGEVSDLRED